MTRPQAPRSVLLTSGAWLVCMLLASCGDDSPKGSTTTSTERGGQTAAVEIASPADSTRVRARVTSSGAWTAALRVRGTAAAGATVFFRAGCRPRPCLQRTRADGRGRFSATLKVRTQPSVRFVTVDAGPAEVFAEGSDVTTVELYDRRAARGSVTANKPRARRRAGRALPREVLVIGDSLAVGFGPALKEELEGWRVRIDARVSRPLREGMRIVARQGNKAPAILAFSLFTNNSPRETGDLETAVRATATRAGSCAVWATIVRPSHRGRTYAATNRMLTGLVDEQLALGLRIVDWAGAVESDRSLLARDRIHATPVGYATLARMYAAAIRACAGASR